MSLSICLLLHLSTFPLPPCSLLGTSFCPTRLTQTPSPGLSWLGDLGCMHGFASLACFPIGQMELRPLPLTCASSARSIAHKALKLPAPKYDHISALGGEQDRRPREGQRLAQGHTASGAGVSSWPGYFSTAPMTGRGASWQSGPGGPRRGGEDPPCLLRGQRPALWNAAVGQTQSFHPTWWRGARGQLQACFHLLSPCFVPGFISQLLHALPVFVPTETPLGQSDFPHSSGGVTGL